MVPEFGKIALPRPPREFRRQPVSPFLVKFIDPSQMNVLERIGVDVFLIAEGRPAGRTSVRTGGQVIGDRVGTIAPADLQQFATGRNRSLDRLLSNFA